jgi:hypothetical protein
MDWKIREKQRRSVHKRFEREWKHMLRLQLAAYAVVLALWAVPIPNPLKLLAVTFHELSHSIAGLLTGGGVLGFAIAPNGAGVTFGVGGNLSVILIAGYIGSCLWGALLYAASVKWTPAHCLLGLELFVLATAYFGWLSISTQIFGIGSIVLLMALHATPDWVQLFFIRMVGSACCLYAPLEVMGESFRFGQAPSVLGYETQSDIVQIAQQAGMNAVVVSALLLVVQVAIVLFLIQWTCTAGARENLRGNKKELDAQRVILQDLRSFKPPTGSFR